jgi:hypothetical protein
MIKKRPKSGLSLPIGKLDLINTGPPSGFRYLLNSRPHSGNWNLSFYLPLKLMCYGKIDQYIG